MVNLKVFLGSNEKQETAVASFTYSPLLIRCHASLKEVWFFKQVLLTLEQENLICDCFTQCLFNQTYVVMPDVLQNKINCSLIFEVSSRKSWKEDLIFFHKNNKCFIDVKLFFQSFYYDVPSDTRTIFFSK